MLSAMGRISSGRESGHTVHPVSQRRTGSFCRLHPGQMPRSLGARAASRQPGAAAVRADVLLEEFFHPLHALFVLDLGEGIFHRIDRVVSR